MSAVQNIHIAGMPTFPLPYLVFMKLQAARTTDLGDVSRMLGRAALSQVDEARQVVRRFGSVDDLSDSEQLVRIGHLERVQGEPPGGSR